MTPIVWKENRCGAKECKKPKGKGKGGTLFWIDCDVCKTWYHKVCQNLPEDESIIKKYKCKKCNDDKITYVARLTLNAKKNQHR